MVSDSKTNIVYVSHKLMGWYPDTFNEFLKLLNSLNIEHGVLADSADIWARDYMPFQLSETKFLKYKYYPDYLDNEKERKYITDCTKACKALNISCTETDIKLDGGNITMCGDYIVMTDKVFTENKKEKYDTIFAKQLEDILHHEIIFIPWHQIYKDEPYGHSDGFIHWCGGNKVLMTDHFQSDKKEATIIKQRLEEKGFEVIVMKFNVAKPNYNFNWAYINYLQVGNDIIMPTFGIDEDQQALRYISDLNPGCRISSFRMNEIANEGGALHCITWNIKISRQIQKI